MSVSHKFIRDLPNYSANGYGEEKAYGNGLVDYEYACVPRHLRIYYNSQQLRAARGAEYDDATYRLYKMRYYSSNAGEKNANILEAYKVISVTIE